MEDEKLGRLSDRVEEVADDEEVGETLNEDVSIEEQQKRTREYMRRRGFEPVEDAEGD